MIKLSNNFLCLWQRSASEHEINLEYKMEKDSKDGQRWMEKFTNVVNTFLEDSFDR